MKQESLGGLRALVTGAGIRLGRALAIGLAEAGCDVVVHYASSETEAAETVEAIKAFGRRARVVRADFRDADAPARLAAETVNCFGGLDILVNNASVYPAADLHRAEKTILKEELADWELALAVNARAPYFLIQALAHELRRSRNGNIVNILDSSVTRVYLSRASHTVSKWALAAVTQLAAGTLYPTVRVNALELGAILPGEDMTDEERVKKLWVGVDDVLSALRFVLLTRSIQGQVIRVGDPQSWRPVS